MLHHLHDDLALLLGRLPEQMKFGERKPRAVYDVGMELVMLLIVEQGEKPRLPTSIRSGGVRNVVITIACLG